MSACRTSPSTYALIVKSGMGADAAHNNGTKLVEIASRSRQIRLMRYPIVPLRVNQCMLLNCTCLSQHTRPHYGGVSWQDVGRR
jgi:hypothetical protein